MGFKIISSRDKDGNFIASADQWNDEKIDELLIKYNPKGRVSRERAKQSENNQEKS